MQRMNPRWDHDTGLLTIDIPPAHHTVTCVLFGGREVKRVEIRDGSTSSIWDSCNGPAMERPTPISGGIDEHPPRGVGRELSFLVMHADGISCYMAHGPASDPVLDEPKLRVEAHGEDHIYFSARYSIAPGELAEVVVVCASIDALSARDIRTHAEALATLLLRERMEDDVGWRAVA